MIFRPFLRFDTGCASYVLGCGGQGLCAVVDPRADDLDAYVAFAEQKSMRITHVVDTHVHADHDSGGPELAARTGATYCMHERAEVSHSFEPLGEHQEIVLGNVRLRVLHTPGHTPESISLLVTDLRRGPEPWFLLTGDTLFSGAVGRPTCRATCGGARPISTRASAGSSSCRTISRCGRRTSPARRAAPGSAASRARRSASSGGTTPRCASIARLSSTP